MPTAENAKVEYEGGQSAVAMAALTDSGDRTTFTSSASKWSRRSGFAPVVRPNGLLTGAAVSPGTTADEVAVTAGTCNLNGVVTTVAAVTDLAITRPGTNVAKVCSIVVNSSGTYAEVEGTAASDANFVETRGAAGGPPYIPVDAIEVGQVRIAASGAAVFTTAEINTTVGLHREDALNPAINSIDYRNGQVVFSGAAPAIHTGDTARRVFASYATPIMAELPEASDFVPSYNAYSVSSEQIYGKTIGSKSASLNAGTFTAYLEDGINDPLAQLEGENLWFRFYPDKFKTAHIWDQGTLGLQKSYPPDGSIQAACTIAAEQKSFGATG